MTAPRALADIVRRLGGELYDGGRRALVRGPGHGPGDRSVSLLVSGGRIIVHSFAGDDWRAVRAYMRAEGLVVAEGEPGPRADGAVACVPSRPERLAAALALWDTARPAGGTAAEAYAGARGVRRALPEALRFHPAAPSAVYAGAGRRRPALLAAIRDPAGAIRGVEVTYLPDGSARRLPAHRKTVGGRPAGSAVRLDPPAETLAVGEGVFSCLSASEALGLPAWALLAVGNLRGWRPPPGVARVVIAADRGAAGECGAAVLRSRLRGLRIAAEICLPPAPYVDWNDAGRAAAPGGGGGTGGGGPGGRIGRSPVEEPSR